MDVDTIINYNSEKDFNKTIGENASLNVKRVFTWNKNWSDEKNKGHIILPIYKEIKTTWHLIENIGVSGIKY